MTEKYARPGLYLDEDDHEKLIDENKEQYKRERKERLVNEIREKEAKLEEIE